jgi:hypothetical protein
LRGAEKRQIHDGYIQILKLQSSEDNPTSCIIRFYIS